MTTEAEKVAELIGVPSGEWHHNCHSISLKIVRSGILGKEARVARGMCPKVPSQHSWITVGDCYGKDTPIVDPTLWCYDEQVDDIWSGTREDNIHFPHGHGSIWAYGRPPEPTSEIIKLEHEFSSLAESFLSICGPLDLTGWIFLAHAPVEGWPSSEIIDAMCDHPMIHPHIPIDRIGMLTNRNPNNLYF